MEFIEACRNLISIDSTPSCGSMEAAEFVADHCKNLGLHVELQTEYVGDMAQANVIARVLPTHQPAEFLFQAHLDTADPGPFQFWEKTGHNPFDAHIIDGKIFGLGAAEVKLDILCKAEALARYAGREKFKLPPVLVGTYGEETGMQGALRLIRKNKVSAKMAMIGEPSDLKVINAAKGFASVEIRVPFSEEEIRYRQEHDFLESSSTQSKIFSGKAAHSSTPHLGESAIRKMFEYLMMMPSSVAIMELDGGTNYNQVAGHAMIEIDVVSAIQEPIIQKLCNINTAILKLEEAFQTYRDVRFLPETPTLNIGLVRTFQDHILITGTCRMPPMITQAIYEDWMRQLNEACVANKSNFRITDYKKPFRVDDSSLLLKGCVDEVRSLRGECDIITQASTNEASIFSRLGIDCICFGPGRREGNVHTPGEHVEIADLQTAVEFYSRLIERFCV